MNYFYALLLIISPFLLFGQSPDCSRTVPFGDVEICLPKLEGMRECYEYPTVKTLADATEAPMNKVLGYYLNEATYEKREDIAEAIFDDFIKFYGTRQIATVPVDATKLADMRQMVGVQLGGNAWDEVQKIIDESFDDLQVGQPTMLESYQDGEDSFTFVVLVPFTSGETTVNRVLSVSGMILSERLVWMAYYLNFDGQSSVDAVKAKTKTIVAAALKIN